MLTSERVMWKKIKGLDYLTMMTIQILTTIAMATYDSNTNKNTYTNTSTNTITYTDTNTNTNTDDEKIFVSEDVICEGASLLGEKVSNQLLKVRCRAFC